MDWRTVGISALVSKVDLRLADGLQYDEDITVYEAMGRWSKTGMTMYSDLA